MLGHLQTVCNKKNSDNRSQNESKSERNKTRTNYVSEKVMSENENVWNLYSINQENKGKVLPKIVEVKMARQIVKMEIDSGAGLSVIPESLYKSLLADVKLNECKKILSNYDESQLKVLGDINVLTEYNEKKNMCSVVVAKRNGDIALMGRDMMKAFGFFIAEIMAVDQNDKINTLLKKYEELFDGKLGELKGEIIDLKTKEGVKPIFMKPRPVPFAFKKQVEDEIIR